MKLISMFSKDGNTFVRDEENNIYLLQRIEESDIPELDIVETPPSLIEASLVGKIKTMLAELSVPNDYSGYQLLIHCLYFVIKDPKYRGSFSRNLYPEVSKNHPNLLESSIPGTLNTLVFAWGRTRKYQEIFGAQTISPKKLILGLADYYEAHY